jgi:hypothetical protein
MTSLKRFLLALAISSFVVAGSARADSLFNNLGNAGFSADPTGDEWGPLADSFSTGSTPFDFTSLTVILSGTPSPTGSTTAFLLSDSSNTPGAIVEEIGTISESGLSGAPGLFTLPTSYILQPNTTYWIELTSADNNTDWQYTMDPSGIGTAGQSLANFQGSGNWVVFPEDNGPYQMSVDGTRVPEPSSLYLLFGGLLAVGITTFRRRIFARAN